MNLAPIEPAVVVRDIFDAALHREPNAVEMRFWAANVSRTGSCRDLLQKLSRSVGAWRAQGDGWLFVPLGHFYSPIVDPSAVATMPFPPADDGLPEIAIDDAAMLELWRRLAPLAAEASFPDHAVPGRRFYGQNPNFGHGDAVVLSAMFGHLRPRRVVEVGAGFSSACMLDVRDDRKLADLEFTFIDPDPALFERLAGTAAMPGVRLVPRRVQEAERSIFESLGAGDVLFIDSSHVAKTGSDVNHLIFSVLPALNRGVVVHFHDIFDGFEYPRDWVVTDNRSWNEIYFVRAFLMHNHDYRTLFFNDRFLQRQRSEVEASLPRLASGLGGGLWLQKLAAPVGENLLMSVRRLADVQPASFAFTEANLAWAQKTIAKYPPGRQASAVISLLWRAQEQEGWVSEPAIRVIAAMLDMPKIRVLEIATFYTMFLLAPVGKVAHIQVCGTTPCWLRGANDLKDVCRHRIHHDQFAISEDGNFSWEEVECIGACVNAPLVQIRADTFEDLTPELFEKLIDDLAAGRPVKPGSQIGRQNSAPLGGPTTLKDIGGAPTVPARRGGDDQAPINAAKPKAAEPTPPDPAAQASQKAEAVADGQTTAEKRAEVLEEATGETIAVSEADRPQGLATARAGRPDDLKRVSGIGPKIEGILNGLGIFHFDQIANWTPAEVAWVDDHLRFRGRIGRENWIAQAKVLAAGGETEFSARAGKSAGDGKGE